MTLNSDYVAYVLEQLESVTPCRSRKMFGGAGIYQDDIMFGLISSDNQLYFRVDDNNRPDFEAAGMPQFMSMPYFQLSEELLEDEAAVRPWVEKALAAAIAGKKKKRKKR